MTANQSVQTFIVEYHIKIWLVVKLLYSFFLPNHPSVTLPWLLIKKLFFKYSTTNSAVRLLVFVLWLFLEEGNFLQMLCNILNLFCYFYVFSQSMMFYNNDIVFVKTCLKASLLLFLIILFVLQNDKYPFWKATKSILIYQNINNCLVQI